MEATVESEIQKDLKFLVSVDLISPEKAITVLGLMNTKSGVEAEDEIQQAEVIYEAVPEIIAVKKSAYSWLNQRASVSAIIASTTSTLNVEELAEGVSEPGRFLNAHWLNPAHLMPLVEVSVSEQTTEDSRDRLLESLRNIGNLMMWGYYLVSLDTPSLIHLL